MGFTTSVQRKIRPGSPLKRPVGKGTAPNQSLMLAESGNDVPTQTGDPRFDCTAYQPAGAPQPLSGNLTDVDRGYMHIPYLFGWFDGAAGSGSSKAIDLQVIMESGAAADNKTFDNPPAPAGRRSECVNLDPDDNMGGYGTRITIGVPLPDTVGQETAEFGTFMGNENTLDAQMEGGSILVIPVTDELGIFSQASPTIADHGGGGIFANFGTDLHSAGQSPNPLLGSQVSDDLDVTSVMSTFEIPKIRRNERWLVWWFHAVEKRGSFPTAAARVARWNFEFNGEDFVNVRTNTTTGGSTKNGRGFSWSIPINNFNHGWWTQFRVMDNLPTGRTIQGATNFNIWDASNNTGTPTELDLSNPIIMRTESFNQFEFFEDRNAVVTSSDTFTASAFEVTVEADGTTPWYLGFSTSVHQFEGQTRFRITRDGTPITPDGTEFVTWGQSDQLTHIGGTNGAGDTDNDTLPYHLQWFDTPSAGSHTYRVEYRRNSGFTGANNAMWNCRDDGSSGFIGTMFAAEMSFPTRQPY